VNLFGIALHILFVVILSFLLSAKFRHVKNTNIVFVIRYTVPFPSRSKDWDADKIIY